MLVEDDTIQEKLRQIVAGLTKDAALQEDLMQEAMLHLWRTENEQSGRTSSWYLQSCRFRLHHWLALGRSVDSPKRDRVDLRIPINETGENPALEHYNTNGELFERVSFDDMVSSLGGRLKERERAVLNGLAEGYVLREVACKCGLSYPTALRYRRKIASVSAKLGLAGDRSQESPTKNVSAGEESALTL